MRLKVLLFPPHPDGEVVIATFRLFQTGGQILYGAFPKCTHCYFRLAFRITDDAGNQWLLRVGDPERGKLTVGSNYLCAYSIEHAFTGPQDDEFSILIGSASIPFIDLDKYNTDVVKFKANFAAADLKGDVPNFLFKGKYPLISTYVNYGSGPTWTVFTGRFIRINPYRFAYDVRGHPLYTTFAMAPPCFPRLSLYMPPMLVQFLVGLQYSKENNLNKKEGYQH